MRKAIILVVLAGLVVVGFEYQRTRSRVADPELAAPSSATAASTPTPPAPSEPAQTAPEPAREPAPPVQAVSRSGGPVNNLPPLPLVAYPARPPDVLRAVHDFAAAHPEVLNYVPCFCGCDGVGHKTNEDCFVKSRDSNGSVTAWDEHGMT